MASEREGAGGGESPEQQRRQPRRWHLLPCRPLLRPTGFRSLPHRAKEGRGTHAGLVLGPVVWIADLEALAISGADATKPALGIEIGAFGRPCLTKARGVALSAFAADVCRSFSCDALAHRAHPAFVASLGFLRLIGETATRRAFLALAAGQMIICDAVASAARVELGRRGDVN